MLVSMIRLVAFDNEGTLWAWGAGYHGQLGIGSAPNNQSTPARVLVPEGRTFTQVMSDGVAVAIDDQGNGWVWGTNVGRTLGAGQDAYAPSEQILQPVPVVMPDGAKFTEILANGGDWVRFVRGDDGKVYSWGQGNNGTLGTV